MTAPKLLGARPRVSQALQSAALKPFTPRGMAEEKVKQPKDRKKKGSAASALDLITRDF